MRFERITLRGMGPFARESTLDLAAVRGPLVAIAGGNGAGKSTLLELLAGALYRETPTRGSLASLATARDAFAEVSVANGRSWTIRQVVDATSGKGEALVLDERGAAVLPSGKVREYDHWARAHLPSPEVLYASTFAAQGSGGFLELGAGERKGVLLRVLGVERLETLAGAARERARDARARLATVTARVADERERGGDVAAAESEIARALGDVERADEAAAVAAEVLRRAEAEVVEAAAESRRAEEARARRAEIATRLEAARSRLADLERRAAEGAALAARGPQIRAAVAALTGVIAREAEVRVSAAQADADAAMARRDAAAHRERVDVAQRRADAAARRAQTARAELRARLDAARATVADIETRVANHRAVLADADVIRAAVARIAELDARAVQLGVEIAGHEAAARDAARDEEAALERAATAQRSAEDAVRRLEVARARLADRAAIEAESAGLAERLGALAQAEAAVERIEHAIEATRALRLSGADGRITSLRTALDTIGHAGSAGRPALNGSDMQHIALDAITEDDRAATALAEAPAREDALRQAASAMRAQVEACRRGVAAAEQATARLLDLAGTQADADEALAASARAESERHGATAAARAADEARRQALSAAGPARLELDDLRRERTTLTTTAARADRLAVAEGRLAELEPQLAAARATATALGAELDALPADGGAEEADALADARREDEAARAADAAAAQAAQAAQAARLGLDDLAEERAVLAPVAAAADVLAQVEAVAGELERQGGDARTEVAALETDLAAAPAPREPAPPPDLEHERRCASETAVAARQAHAALVVAAQRLETARASAGRLAELDAQRAGVEADLAAATLLADSLGRDGLQSALIDAAGPELTVLVNDLLHTCVGSRWTVTIEASRLSSDGTRQIEGCEVRVLDTERGREGTAESLSGGERVLVGEAVSLALSMLACRRSGVERPTLVRDESGAALDAANGRAWIAMLRRAAEIVGADKVLFVSHAPEIVELADARVIVRDGGIEVHA
jgi:exonuclease SbcC